MWSQTLPKPRPLAMPWIFLGFPSETVGASHTVFVYTQNNCYISCQIHLFDLRVDQKVKVYTKPVASCLEHPPWTSQRMGRYCLPVMMTTPSGHGTYSMWGYTHILATCTKMHVCIHIVVIWQSEQHEPCKSECCSLCVIKRPVARL